MKGQHRKEEVEEVYFVQGDGQGNICGGEEETNFKEENDDNKE